MKVSKSDLVAYVLYFNICFIWGTSNLAKKIGVGGLSVPVFACFRYLITGIVALTVTLFLKKGHRFPKGIKEWITVLCVALTMNFATEGFGVLGNKYTDSGLVTVIYAAVPVIMTVIDSLILRNYRLGKRGWIGLIGGISGISVITFWGSGGITGSLKGVGFILLSAIFWAIGSIYSKERPVHGSVVTHVAIEALFSSSLFYITGRVTNSFTLEGVPFSAFYPVIYLALIDSLISFMSYIVLLKVWKPSVVSTYAYINPVVALILGAIVLDEKITAGKVLGMIIIIISVVLIQKDRVSGVDYKPMKSVKD